MAKWTSARTFGLKTYNFDRERADCGEAPNPESSRTALGKTGEMRLVATLLDNAIEESFRAKCQLRDEAREWLSGAPAAFFAQYCFEAMGLDYDTCKKALQKQWQNRKQLYKTKKKRRER